MHASCIPRPGDLTIAIQSDKARIKTSYNCWTACMCMHAHMHMACNCRTSTIAIAIVTYSTVAMVLALCATERTGTALQLSGAWSFGLANWVPVLVRPGCKLKKQTNNSIANCSGFYVRVHVCCACTCPTCIHALSSTCKHAAVVHVPQLQLVL